MELSDTRTGIFSIAGHKGASASGYDDANLTHYGAGCFKEEVPDDQDPCETGQNTVIQVYLDGGHDGVATDLHGNCRNIQKTRRC